MMNMDWYDSLNKPWWTPGDEVFSLVWPLLYLLMLVSLILVYRRNANKDKAPYVWFLVQLALNLLWTPVFFGQREIGWALAIAIFLVITVAAMIRAFFRYSKAAAWLQVPYLLWGGFAVALNFVVWFMN